MSGHHVNLGPGSTFGEAINFYGNQIKVYSPKITLKTNDKYPQPRTTMLCHLLKLPLKKLLPKTPTGLSPTALNALFLPGRLLSTEASCAARSPVSTVTGTIRTLAVSRGPIPEATALCPSAWSSDIRIQHSKMIHFVHSSQATLLDLGVTTQAGKESMTDCWVCSGNSRGDV